MAAASYAASVTEARGGWRTFGERTVYDNRWVGLGLVDVVAPNGARVEAFLWRGAEQIGAPTDTEEVGRVEWVPLSGVPELAQRGELLGSGTLVALLYYLASRGSAAAAG